MHRKVQCVCPAPEIIVPTHAKIRRVHFGTCLRINNLTFYNLFVEVL